MAIVFASDGANTNGTGVCTLGGSVAIGDMIVVAYDTYSTAASPTLSATDNVNSGNYTIGTAPIINVSGSTYVNILWKLCNASGTPTITVVGGGSLPSTGRVFMTHLTGFLGTATAISTDAASSYATSTALTSGAFNTSQNA